MPVLNVTIQQAKQSCTAETGTCMWISAWLNNVNRNIELWYDIVLISNIKYFKHHLKTHYVSIPNQSLSALLVLTLVR